MSTAAEQFGVVRDDSEGVPASAEPRPAAGPFDAVAPAHKASGLNDALVTGLLVIYPAFAAVAAIIAGLALSGK